VLASLALCGRPLVAGDFMQVAARSSSSATGPLCGPPFGQMVAPICSRMWLGQIRLQ